MPSRRTRAALILLAFVCCLLAAAPAGTGHAAPPVGAAVLAFPVVPAAPAAGAEEAEFCQPLDPFCLIGSIGGEIVTDVWTTAMLALWEAGLWLLGLAFGVIDALTTPDLSADGPLREVYPVTFGIGAAVAGLMALVQLGAAAFRRDGQSLARILVGVGQFGIVWLGYVAVAATLVTGVAGLTTGLLQGLLGIDTLAAFETTVSTPEQITDATVATVLGLSAIFLLFPAAAAYLLLMLVREAALMLLAATSAISAGGLLAETTRAWFWKSLRWFIAALLISPVAVLILGIGVSITEGVVGGDGDEAEIGMAIVGCLLILIGAICPLILFKLLAFVDPGTSSGTAMRQSLSASGGVLGLAQSLGGGGHASGAGGSGAASTGAATRTTAGRAQGESTAEGATGGRFAGAMRVLVAGSAKAGQVAGSAAAAGSDVLSMGGVGHTSPYYAQPGTTVGGGGRAGGHGAGGASPAAEPPPSTSPAGGAAPPPRPVTPPIGPPPISPAQPAPAPVCVTRPAGPAGTVPANTGPAVTEPQPQPAGERR